MKLSCPTCRGAIEGADVNVGALIAKCRQCGAVFAFESQVARGATPMLPMKHEVAIVPLPTSMKVFRTGAAGALVPVEDAGPYRSAPGKAERGELRIVRYWFRPAALGLLLFAIVWDSFLAFWYSKALGPGPVPWLMIVFPIGHLAVGVWITYSALCQLVNRTVVTVDATHVRSRTGPIPIWGGRVDLQASEIAQLIVSTKWTKNKNGSTAVYSVVARLVGGGFVPLVRKLETMEQARYIEQTIEAHLELVDEPGALAPT